MKIFFRCDASNSMGTGHVMRCLTLADELRSRGVNIRFICRAHPGNMIELLQRQSMPVSVLPPPEQIPARCDENYAGWLGVSQEVDAAQTIKAFAGEHPDWLVVDHYGLDEEWESILRGHSAGIMVIDDLANRKHKCDLLLDQNYVENPGERYKGLVPDECKLFLGPRYALLRPEYRNVHKTMRSRLRNVQGILVCFGGSDRHNMTGLTLEALTAPEFQDLKVEIVLGQNNSHRVLLEEKASMRPKTTLYYPQKHLADLMRNNDLAIGAGGVTMWERLCMGIPSLVICVAMNQKPSCEALAGAGIIRYGGDVTEVDSHMLRATIGTMISDPKMLAKLSKRGQLLVDGSGSQSVCECIVTTRLNN